MDDQINLTVGGLLCALQNIANRCGNDTPVVVPTLADADYEQATAPFIMHAKPDGTTDDCPLFKVVPDGEAIAVIS